MRSTNTQHKVIEGGKSVNGITRSMKLWLSQVQEQAEEDKAPLFDSIAESFTTAAEAIADTLPRGADLDAIRNIGLKAIETIATVNEIGAVAAVQLWGENKTPFGDAVNEVNAAVEAAKAAQPKASVEVDTIPVGESLLSDDDEDDSDEDVEMDFDEDDDEEDEE